MPVLTPETEARLISVATTQGRTPDEVVRELLRGMEVVPSLPEEESELLLAIQKAVPLSLRQERDALAHEQQERPWTSQERARFLELTNQIESCEARRISLLAALARKRGVSLKELATQLGLAAS
jgi:hypothetical protein